MTNINTVSAKNAIYNISECGDTNQLKRWLNQEMAESGKGRVTVRDAIFKRIGEIQCWKDEKEMEAEMEEEDYGLIQMLDKIQKKDEKNYEEEGEKMSINIDDHQKKIKFLEWLNFQHPVAENYLQALRVKKVNGTTVHVWILGMFYKQNRQECYMLLKEIGTAAKSRGFKVTYEKPPRGQGYMKIVTK